MSERRIWVDASRVVAILAMCIGVLLSACIPKAFADDEVKTYQDSNGWELAYSVSDDGSVTIEDVVAAGSGMMVIPTQIDGCDVTAFASKAFYNEGGSDFTAQLSEIEIPDTVTSFGTYAFMGSGIKRVTIPASVQAIPAYCFGGCSQLEEVTFESESIGYFGEAAFSGCSSLTRIDVPELTKTVGNETYRMGRKCFYRCSNLETIVFHGNVNTYDPSGKAHSGNVNSSITSGYYAANIDCFSYCENLKSVVYYCKRDSIPSGTGSYAFGSDSNNVSSSNREKFGNVAAYVTLAFYGSKDDSDNCSNPVYTISCKTSVKVRDILNGSVDQGDIWDEWGERPALDDDMTWGICWGDEESSRVYENTKLSNSYNVIPVSKNDLAYGWVSSDVISEYRDTVSETGSMGVQNYPVYYLDAQQKVYGLDKLSAYLPDGNPANPSTYKVVFQKETSTTLDRATVTTYEDVDAPDSTGYYRLRAEGVSGASAGTHTSWFIISVASFSPSINYAMDANSAVRLGRASQAMASKVSGQAVCNVVVPSDDWRYQLIGAGLAGVGNGVLLYDCGADFSTRTVTAFIETKATALQVVGSTAVIPESDSPSAEAYLMDYLNERGIQNKTRYSNDSTIQGLADQVYAAIRRLEKNGNDVYGNGWGTTAVVASPDCCVDILPIAQYAYSSKAPVFFIQSNGKLSSTDLGYLKNDGFENVIIAGDESYVSEECASEIQSQCGIAAVRMYDSESNSLDACLGSLDAFEHGCATTVIAAANEPSNITAAALVAAVNGGAMLTCSSTSDSKRIQEHLCEVLSTQGQSSISAAYLIGDFASVDSGIKSRVSSIWSSPESTEVGVGDTVEIGDFVYRLKQGKKVSIVSLRNPDLTDAVLEDVAYDGLNYAIEASDASSFSAIAQIRSISFKTTAITSIPAGALKNAAVKTVDLGSSITSIGESAFEGCKSLARVRGTAVTAIGGRAFANCSALYLLSAAKVATVGASAFQNCSSLPSVALPAMTSLGASAFQNCTALTSVSLPKISAVGDSAFQGCTALSSLNVSSAKSLGTSCFAGCTALKTFASSKVTTIGDFAFMGCSKLAKASFTASGLTKIGSKAFFKCSKLKKLTLKTKKLKKKWVGAKAFKGMPKKAKVYVPKKKIKAYKKIFVKKGLPKKASIVKA